MAPIKASNLTARQHNVHFSPPPPKQANPFIVRDAIETPPITDARHGLRPGRALLSEQVTLERQRISQKKPPRSRDILSPKHAGISKSGHRTPLAPRNRNSKMSGHHRNVGTAGNPSAKPAHRRVSKVQPAHPLSRLLEEALSNYRTGISIDLPAKLALAKSSIEGSLHDINQETSGLPSTVLAASAAPLTPLDETPLQITLQESAEVFEQPLSRRFEDFRGIVLRERKRLEGLWKRHADVVGRIGLLQKAVAAGATGSTVMNASVDEASYVQESLRIKQEYRTAREKLLSDFESEAEKVRESVIKCEEAWAKKRRDQKAREDKFKREFFAALNADDEY